MSDDSTRLTRRTALKGLGGVSALALGGLSLTGGGSAQMASTFEADPVSISSDTGDVDEVHVSPVSRVDWRNFDVPVTKVRQLLMARIVDSDGAPLTPTDSATPQTEDGWWPIYRETPWLFETTGAGASLPESVDGCGTLVGEGDTVRYEAPAGTLSNDESPSNPNHAEVFVSDGDADWDVQIRYATGSNQAVPVMAGWSYQEKGGAWKSGLPSGYSASIDGDTLAVTTPGYTHAGAALTTVDGDANSETCYIAAEGAAKPWDQGGLISASSPAFQYNDDGAEFHKWPYMNTLKVNGFTGQKETATSGTLEYALLPSSGPNAGAGPIYVVKEGAVLPTYEQAELTGVSLGQTPAKLNGSYGAVGNTDRFDNATDGSTETTTVELGLLTTLHTDYDFAENVSVPSDPNPDRLTPLAMGNSDDVAEPFGADTHAIPYSELIANADGHPAVEWQTTSFDVDVHNEDTSVTPQTGGDGGGTTAGTGGS